MKNDCKIVMSYNTFENFSSIKEIQITACMKISEFSYTTFQMTRMTFLECLPNNYLK